MVEAVMADTSALLQETTARQQAAANPHTSAWVSANAGTGKTHVLVNRVARLLLAGAPPSRILCITYTKAAAAEMTQRLFERLGKWSMADDNALRKELRELEGERADEEDLRRARRLFARALETPGGLKIQTIHAFCQTVLTRFPIEAGVSPGFTMIDEETAAELQTRARHDMLSRIVAKEDAALSAAHAVLVAELGDQSYRELLDTVQQRSDRIESAEDAFASLDALRETMARHLGLSPDASPSTILADACADDAADRDGLLRAADALKQGAKTSQTAAICIETFWHADDRPALWDDYLQAFMTQKLEPRKTLTTKGAEKADPGAADILFAEQARLELVLGQLRAARIVELSHAALTVGHAYRQTYEHLKRQQGALDFNDLIIHTRHLLSGGGDAWVHYKLDEGIDHVLVDEAQDTSPPQWDVVRLLTREMTTGFGAAEDRERDRTVFAVGDIKQSIYRFQGAEPREFTAMRDHFAAHLGEAVKPFKALELILSFRSAAPILEAVDAVMAQHDDGVGPVTHQTRHADAPGLVELWPPFAPEDTEPEVPWDVPLDSVTEESPPGKLARRIAETIKGWIESGEQLTGFDRPIRPSDVMILVRQRNAFMEHMIRQLKTAGVPVAGADRLKIAEHIAVQDLLAVAAFALMPSDDLTLATVLKTPFIGFDEDQLYALAHGRKGGLWAELGKRRDETPAFAAAHDWLDRVRDRADFMAPYEFFSRVLVDDGGLAKLLARLGPDAEDPIDELLTLALGHEHLHPPSLEEFVQAVRTGKSDIKRDMDKGPDEVRVMTVHGAKGLESPIVFLPDTCTRPASQSDRGFLTAELSDGAKLMLFSPRKPEDDPVTGLARAAYVAETEREYRRLLYVAMTRAQERLYVAGYVGTRGRQDGCWHELVETALQEIGTPFEVAEGEGLRLARDGTPREAGKDEGAKPSRPAIPAWARAPAPEETPRRRLSPSALEDESAAFKPTEDGRIAIERGKLVHRLLETLPELEPGKREAAAQAYLTRFGTKLSEADREELLTETLRLFELPETSILFGANSRAEVGISGAVTIGGVSETIAGRIDRLAVTDDAVWVLDYKTNRPAPTDITKVPRGYIRQMAAYREVLREAYPSRAIRAALLWTHGPHLMELPEDLLEKEWAELCG